MERKTVVHLRYLESENDLKKKTWTLKSEQHINKQVKQYLAVLPLLPLLPLPTVSHSGALKWPGRKCGECTLESVIHSHIYKWIWRLLLAWRDINPAMGVKVTPMGDLLSLLGVTVTVGQRRLDMVM